MKEFRSFQSEAFTTFLQENKSLLSNPIVKSFLEKKIHFLLLKKAIEFPTKENKEKLDESFKKHFFTIRFTAYITSSMEYSTINFNKNLTMYQTRFPLMLAAKEEGGEKDITLHDKEAEIERIVEKEVLRASVEEYIADKMIYSAILSLTTSQRAVLTYAYLYKLTDTEIARTIGTSQQYVSKTRKVALQRILSFMNGRRKVDGIDRHDSMDDNNQ
ncbi:sigma factor-like helix-turn-helix DNA-binding protein [Niallia sp. JL1B1071]|uniref:sigma factor-like helix-turn-helix DNA-binding protein n=1 Tax=Niallia tiangongensis TaxID=3237105 RepID=UPI0037DCEEDF